MGFAVGKTHHRSSSSNVSRPYDPTMDLADAVELIEITTGRIADLAGAADLTTPVERLGRWRAEDVVAHLGGVHEWASRIVRARSMDGPGFRKSKLRGAELAAWYAETAADLVETLRTSHPDDACPNFNPGSAPTTAFWIRRQLHETLIHAYDLDRVLGEILPIPRSAAVDGIDEHLDVFIRTRGKQTLAAPLALTVTDGDESWTLAPATKPGRVDVDPPNVEPVAVMTGSAMNVVLVLWNRLTVAEAKLEVSGDEAVVASFRA